MNAKKTGAFIAALRKERGWTQQELAEKLSVTDKAVSRWETGKGFPDVSILPTLSRTLGVSVGELLNGARMDTEQIVVQTDTVILDTLSYAGAMLKKAACILVAMLGAALLLSPLVTTGDGVYWILGLLLLLFEAALLAFHRFGGKLRNRGRLVYGAAVALLAAALTLEIIPGGTVLRFAVEPGETMVQTFSYFSLTPFGYANFTPLLTGILTALLLLTGCLVLFKKKKIDI